MIFDFLSLLKKENDFKSSWYSVEDMYLNGECETLVLNLALLTDFKGKRIEIRQGDTIHYVYQYENRFYDIRGAFDSIEEIIKQTDYFDEWYDDYEDTQITEMSFDYFFSYPTAYKSLIHKSIQQKLNQYCNEI